MKKKILPIIIIVLIVVVSISAYLNKQSVQEKKEMMQEAKFQIIIDDKSVAEPNMEEIMNMDPVQYEANINKSGKDPVTHNFTGVPLINILEKYKVDLSEKLQVIATAVDGYTVAYSISEVKDKDNIYITYKMDDKLLGPKEEGGRGPFMLVVREDPFSQRWCKFLIEVKVQ